MNKYKVVYRTKRKLNAGTLSLIVSAENLNQARANAIKEITFKNTILKINRMEE